MARSPGRPLRAAVVDDCELVVAGIAAVLEPYSDRVQVLDLDAAGLADVDDVDILLYDTSVPARRRALDIIRQGPEGTKVVVFSWNTQVENVALAFEDGADGYVPKSWSAEEIVSALERVYAGERVRPRQEPAGSVEDLEVSPAGEHGLSDREAEILQLIAQGLTNQQIAERCYLSINSVKTHIRSAYRKIGVERRSQAVAWGLANGFGAGLTGSPDSEVQGVGR